MNLVSDRERWRQIFESGSKIFMPLLFKYREYRNSEDWRSSRGSEIMCEYILYLEDQLKIERDLKDDALAELSIYKTVCGVSE